MEYIVKRTDYSEGQVVARFSPSLYSVVQVFAPYFVLRHGHVKSSDAMEHSVHDVFDVRSLNEFWLSPVCSGHGKMLDGCLISHMIKIVNDVQDSIQKSLQWQ